MAENAEIQISLRKSPKHIYGPEDKVAGSVIFKPAFNAKLKEMKVSFKGECYTSSLGANAKISNTVPLFGIVCDLMQEVYTYQGRTYEARFEFTFPTESPSTYETGPRALMPLFNQYPQYLPDSFVLSTRNTVQMVRYYIQVELKGRTSPAQEKVLLFRQPFTRLLEDWEELQEEWEPLGTYGLSNRVTDPTLLNTARRRRTSAGKRKGILRDPKGPPLSLHGLPMMSGRHKSLLERYQYAKLHRRRSNLQWLCKPWKTTKVTFMPSLYLPQRISIGQEIPLMLTIEAMRNPLLHKGKSEPLVLEGFSLAIIAHTRTIMQAAPSKNRWGRCMELTCSVLEVNGLATTVAVDDADPIHLVKGFKILPGTIPSFATYTISRGYSIDISLRFNYDGDQLEWVASMALEIKSDDSIPPVPGRHIDPLLLADPKQPPQYFWFSGVEAGAAESTGRARICTSDPLEQVSLEGEQRKTGHGRILRSSYGCASANVAPGLTPVRKRTRMGWEPALSVVGGVYGRPNRRYLKTMEPVVAPLGNFVQRGLGLQVEGGDDRTTGFGYDGTGDKTEGHGMISIDQCGILSFARSHHDDVPRSLLEFGI